MTRRTGSRPGLIGRRGVANGVGECLGRHHGRLYGAPAQLRDRADGETGPWSTPAGAARRPGGPEHWPGTPPAATRPASRRFESASPGERPALRRLARRRQQVGVPAPGRSRGRQKGPPVRIHAAATLLTIVRPRRVVPDDCYRSTFCARRTQIVRVRLFCDDHVVGDRGGLSVSVSVRVKCIGRGRKTEQGPPRRPSGGASVAADTPQL